MYEASRGDPLSLLSPCSPVWPAGHWITGSPFTPFIPFAPGGPWAQSSLGCPGLLWFHLVHHGRVRQQIPVCHAYLVVHLCRDGLQSKMAETLLKRKKMQRHICDLHFFCQNSSYIFYISFARNWNCFWALIHTLLRTQRKNGKTLRYFVQKALRLTLCKGSLKEILLITKTKFNSLYKTYFIAQISFSPWANIVKWWNLLVTWFAAPVVGCRRAQSDKR